MNARVAVVFLFLGSVAMTVAGAGCGLVAAGGDDQSGEAVDSLESLTAEGALLSVAVDDAPTGMSPEEIAKAAAANAKTRLSPSDCVVATANGAQVTYVLTRCRGPYGLVQATGTVKVDFSAGTGGLVAKAGATGLKVNSATIDVNATAVYSLSGATKRLQVSTEGVGAGARGSDFVRKGSYSATWDGSCLSLDGTWMTTALSRTWTTTVAGFKHCTGKCPSAGAVLTYTGGISGTTTTVTLDGDNTAAYSTSKGRTGAVVIHCGN